MYTPYRRKSWSRPRLETIIQKVKVAPTRVYKVHARLTRQKVRVVGEATPTCRTACHLRNTLSHARRDTRHGRSLAQVDEGGLQPPVMQEAEREAWALSLV